MTHYIEPSREIPISGNSDVVVCGGGPAGIAAALAAARAGAKTRLIEVNGCLGGVWTAGLLAWLYEMDQPGISQEITRELDRRGARTNVCTHCADKYAYDVEAMKVLLEEMLQAAGVEFHLHTRVVAPILEGRQLKGVVTESKSGREAWSASCFIDATGDGDLAALSGCGFDFGKPGNGALQPFTFMALVTARDIEALKPFIVFSEGFIPLSFESPTANFYKEIQAAGEDPSYHASTLFHLRDKLLALMINHEYNGSPINERDVTRATVRGRAEVNRVVNALRSRGGPWEDLLLVATAEQIGTREGRRIHGRYTVTEEDIRNGAWHNDAVCKVSFGIDVHSTNPKAGKGFEPQPFSTKSYDIPLRALLSKDLDNLVMAGRCISGDFLAHSSYRVTGVSVALGQAAGTTAALSVREQKLPSELSFPVVKNALEKLFSS
ncbi:MAG: FAD-dependent oxidoreductase [Chthoniobacteraceae bacterium]